MRQVLEQIHIKTGWEVYLEPGFDLEISTAFEDLNQGRAIGRLLSTANFALLPGDHHSARLMVFETTRERATEKLLEAGVSKEDFRLIVDELIITVKDRAEAEKIARELGAEIVEGIDELGTYRLKFRDKEAADEAREALKDRDDVKAVDSNYEIRTPEISLPLSGNQVPIPSIRPGGNSSDTLVIGLVDTAIQLPGGAIGEFFLKPISIAGEVQPSGLVPTHATSMANDILFQMAELVGPGAEANVKILSVDVFGSNGDTSTFQLGHGLVEAWNNGSTLINASLGSKAPSPWLDGVINQLAAQGAIILAPSGNVPDGLPTYPAANPNVLAVTATAPGGGYAAFANVAPFVDVSMPGSSIVTLTGEPYFVNGTSSATAKATGAIAGYIQQTGSTPQEGVQFLIQARGINP